MTPSSCRRFDAALSGYVDGALDDAERERLLAHLVGCARCRSEVDQLRGVCSLLGDHRKIEPSTPTDLTWRLVSIAGEEAQLPLWSRPFTLAAAARAGQSGLADLPSRRRAGRIRLAAASLLIMTLTLSAAAIGYAAAPAAPSEVADPALGAQAQFSAALSQLPLASDAVNAVMMASGRNLPALMDTAGTADTAGSSAQLTEPPVSAPALPLREHPMDAAAALDTLRTAEQAARLLTYRGVQQVSTIRGRTQVRALVRVDSQPGQGTELTVIGRSGTLLTRGFVPQSDDQTQPDGQSQDPRLHGGVDALGLLAARYQLSGGVGGMVAGRPTVVIDAQTDGQLAGRWWVDQRSGLLLWQEAYDQRGAALRSAGFLSVQTGTKDAFLNHLPPRLSAPVSTAALDLSVAPNLTSRGWACQHTLAGLPMIRLSSDANADPGMVHTVYGDGLTTVSVSQQRGRLRQPPAGFGWDKTLSAWTNRGLWRIASWQSGGTVFTVVTDGTPAQLRASVRGLPHQDPGNRTTVARTTVDRVTAGWARIGDLVIG